MTETPTWFPISVFPELEFHFAGVKYAVVFLGVLYFTVQYISHLKMFHIWVISIALILLGNLAQGNADKAFYQPFYESGYQYYHDTIKITDWHEWLSTFNETQPELLNHTRTHPPFAVLLHYFLLGKQNKNLTILAGIFIFLSSLSLILLWFIFRLFNVSPTHCNLLMLLFAVIPAFNIYSAVSLDGVIATCFTMCLFGLIHLTQKGITSIGLLFFIIGFICSNLLTFGGTFLFLVAILISLKNYLSQKKFAPVIALNLSIIILVILHYWFVYSFHYNHVQSFITASQLENPDGFRGLSEPVTYFMTRIEGISEIALFLSFGCLAVFFHQKELKLSLFDYVDVAASFTLAGGLSLLVILLTGAFRTGETARAALFIYPYLLLVFQRLDRSFLENLSVLAGLQTIIMQLCGSYFW